MDAALSGQADARYRAFLETITHLRPSLHRYCSRMTGSVLDGEDVVQEALFQAYRRLDTFDDTRPLAPWLFRIAHNRCLDLLRRRGFREEAEAEATLKQPPPVVEPDEPDGGPASPRAFERLVLTLPPKERACVLLKDVFEYSLEEIADLVDSTVGGVKAALNRGRSKLARRSGDVGSPRMKTADDIRLLQLYVDRFNERDWDGLRELIAADARLVVADRFAGRVGDSPYFRNYSGSAGSWRMAVGEVDGDAAVIVLRRAGDGWTPAAVVRIDLSDGRITRIADYSHCPWVVPAATSLALDESA